MKGRLEIQPGDGLKALGPVHVSYDVSTCRGKVVFVSTSLWDGRSEGERTSPTLVKYNIHVA